jgi:predicted nucleotidyltransferase
MGIEELEKELDELEVYGAEREQVKQKVLPIVISFARDLIKNYGDIIKAICIFGSAARGKMKEKSDIDVWVIIDDTSPKVSKDIENLRSKIIILGSEKNLHVQITLISEFWNLIRYGSPELVNFLRYGLIVYDSGFLKPTQRMLRLGLIPPSEEAIELKRKSAEIRLKKFNEDIKNLIFDLRYAATDACQSVIMKVYKYIPDPKTIPQYLEKLVNDKKLEKEFVDKFIQLDNLWKNIEHEKIEINIDHLKTAYEISKSIVERMKNVE